MFQELKKAFEGLWPPAQEPQLALIAQIGPKIELKINLTSESSAEDILRAKIQAKAAMEVSLLRFIRGRPMVNEYSLTEADLPELRAATEIKADCDASKVIGYRGIFREGMFYLVDGRLGQTDQNSKVRGQYSWRGSNVSDYFGSMMFSAIQIVKAYDRAFLEIDSQVDRFMSEARKPARQVQPFTEVSLPALFRGN